MWWCEQGLPLTVLPLLLLERISSYASIATLERFVLLTVSDYYVGNVFLNQPIVLPSLFHQPSLFRWLRSLGLFLYGSVNVVYGGLVENLVVRYGVFDDLVQGLP